MPPPPPFSAIDAFAITPLMPTLIAPLIRHAISPPLMPLLIAAATFRFAYAAFRRCATPATDYADFDLLRRRLVSPLLRFRFTITPLLCRADTLPPLPPMAHICYAMLRDAAARLPGACRHYSAMRCRAIRLRADITFSIDDAATPLFRFATLCCR